MMSVSLPAPKPRALETDPYQRLAIARDTYVGALEERDRVEPGGTAYAKAVHMAGVAYAQVEYWRRRVRDSRPKTDR